MHYLLNTLALCGLTMAQYQSFGVDYNFDTMTSTGTALQQIGEYNLLNFQNIVLAGPSATGLLPHTPPNSAAFTLNSQLFEAGQPVQVSAAYTESAISFYNVLQWYYGCVVATEEEDVNIAAACNITATGFDPSGRQVSRQVFSFTPTGAATQPLTKGIFKGFFNIYNMTLQVSNNATVAAKFDNLDVELFEKPGAPFKNS